MKKVLFICCLLLVNQLIFAQSRSRSRSKSQVQTEFGMMGGVNFNNPKISALNTGGNQLSDLGSSNIGFHIGLYSTIDLELFAIQPEVYYSMQGGKYSVNNTQEFEMKMSFIQIPLLGRYNFLEYFHALLGPQFGIPIISEVVKTGSGEDYKDYTKSLEISSVIGVGLTIPEYGISGSLRWVKGFSDMIDAENVSGSGNVTSLKNSMIQISASYAFGGK